MSLPFFLKKKRKKGVQQRLTAVSFFRSSGYKIIKSNAAT
jgi:hypothetical protein